LNSVFTYINLPEIILLIAGLVSCLFLFQEYGASWDAPDLYKYASQSLNTYSFQARAQVKFNLETFIELYKRRIYGPACLVVGLVVIKTLHTISPDIQVFDLWYLGKYLMFVMGGVFSYRFLKYWFKTVTSLYNNELTGGMNGAACKYKEDHWLTCYRDLTVKLNTHDTKSDNIFAALRHDLMRYYTDKRFQVFRAIDRTYPPGSLIFLPLSRQRSTLYPEFPVPYDMKSKDLTLCTARRVSK
jgi:hypothetical protein